MEIIKTLLSIIGMGIILGYWAYCIKWGLTRIRIDKIVIDLERGTNEGTNKHN